MMRMIALMLGLSLWLTASAGENTVRFAVENGRANARIVLPERPNQVERLAGRELQYFIRRATGVELPLADKSAPDQVSLLLGRAGNAGELPPNHFVIKSVPNGLVLAGGDSDGALNSGSTACGTLYAVYEFIERELGVLWLWPDDETGVVVRPRQNLAVGHYDFTGKPSFENVRIRKFPLPWARCTARICSTETMFQEKRSGHAFVDWWTRYGKTNPELFALTQSGRQVTATGSMCVSNPAFHDEIIRLWLEARKRNPDRKIDINCCENDTAGQCICPQCLAWDGPDRRFSFARAERKNVGERYARFYMAVYEKARQIDPEVRVHGYAYSNYIYAPEQAKLHENIVIGMVPPAGGAPFPYHPQYRNEIYDNIRKWAASGCTLNYRPNILGGYAMPENYVADYYDEFQEMMRARMKSVDVDGPNISFATQGPFLYVLSRLMVHPTAKLEALLDEYYSGFGPAAPKIREYWEYWSKYALDNAESFTEIPKKYNPLRFSSFFGFHYAFYAHRLFPDTVFPPAEKLLAEAEKLAAGSPNDLDRVRFLKAGLEHARLCATACAVFANPKSTQAEKLAALSGVRAYRESSLPQWASWLQGFTANGRNEQVAWTFSDFDPENMMELPLEWKLLTDPENSGEARKLFDPATDAGGWRSVKTDRHLERQGIENYHNAWYRLDIEIPAKFAGRRTVLRLGAVDESCKLWINGKPAGTFQYDPADNPDSWKNPLEFDITRFLPASGPVTIVLKVVNQFGRGGLWRPSEIRFFSENETRQTIDAATLKADERSVRSFGDLLAFAKAEDGSEVIEIKGGDRTRFGVFRLDRLTYPGGKTAAVSLEYQLRDPGRGGVDLSLMEYGIGQKELRYSQIKLRNSSGWDKIIRNFRLLDETRRVRFSVRNALSPGGVLQIKNLSVDLTASSPAEAAPAKKTEAVPAEPLVIAHLSDLHVDAPEKCGEIRQAIAEINDDPQIGLVLVTGDWGNLASPEEFELARQLFSEIRKPKMTVPGNHETQWPYEAGTRFKKTFGDDRFALQVGTFPVFGINSSPMLRSMPGFFRSEDLAWLDEQLKKVDPAATVLIATHYPPNPNELGNWFDLGDTLRRNKIGKALIFSGHQHRLLLHNWGGYPGVGGRAFSINKTNPDSGPGWQSIEIFPSGEVVVREKEVGKAPREPVYRFRTGDEKGLYSMVQASRNLRRGRYALKPPERALRVIETGRTAAGGIAFDGGKLFYASTDGALAAFDLSRSDAPELWRVAPGGSLCGGPAAAPGVVLCGATEPGALAAYDAVSGKPLWKYEAPAPVMDAVTVADGVVYAGLGKGIFAAITPDGKALWHVPCGDGEFLARPAVTEELVIAGAWDEHLYALERKTGKLRWKWRVPRQGLQYSPGSVPPAAGGNFVIAGSAAGAALLDAASGDMRYRLPGRNAFGFSADGKTGYIVKNDGALAAFEPAAEKYTEKYAVPVFKHGGASPVREFDGVIYVGSGVGELAAFAANDGRILARDRCGFSPVIDIVRAPDGTVWCVLLEGKLVQFPPHSPAFNEI